MNKLVVLNHKMSLLYDDLYSYIDRINNIDTDNNVIICPSNIYLEAFLNNSDYPIGAQNMHYDVEYGHTGEVSSNQLKSMGIEYVVIGHYERVREFKESASIINQKLIGALDSNIIPILCFGEDMDEDYREVLPKTLDSYLKDINNIEFIIFAYEPIYAIGTGTLPNTNKINEISEFINGYLESKYGKSSILIYGGSVDSSNAREIINIDNLNGVMIGNISSDIKEVERIIKSI